MVQNRRGFASQSLWARFHFNVPEILHGEYKPVAARACMSPAEASRGQPLSERSDRLAAVAGEEGLERLGFNLVGDMTHGAVREQDQEPAFVTAEQAGDGACGVVT